MKRKVVKVEQLDIDKHMEYTLHVKEFNIAKVKRYIIHTFGCAMNEHDSEKLSGMLLDMGYIETDKDEDADLIVFNTCCVRESAEYKVVGNVGALKPFKKEKPDLLIAVCGCMMQQEEVVKYIKEKYRHVDIVFGTHNIHCFPKMVWEVLDKGNRVIDVWEHEGLIREDVPIDRKDKFKAFVTVMYGCNNFCSYCIVPYVRGRERSRAVVDILAEVQDLAKSGIKEITLLGQNVNSYGTDLGEGESFAKLLEELNKIEGIERIRFLTSHPKDLSDELIYAMRDLDKVCESLHLPFQSGSTKVLGEMNRHYSKESYIELVDKIRYHIPRISLSTDVIVGFPGESDRDFLDTLEVIERVKFELAYTFLFSKRLGTPAAKREDQVAEDVAKERFDRLLELQTRMSRETSEDYKGRVVEVLVEGKSRNNPEKLTGRTRSNKVVNFLGGEELAGKLVMVNIDEVKTWSLEGTMVQETL